MFRLTTLFLLLSVLGTSLEAGKYNPVLDVGATAPKWEKLPGIDGNPHSWDDVAAKKVVVVIFTCNTCPYATDYEQRIKDLAKRWSEDKRVAVIAVNSNLIEEDSLEAMQTRAKEAKFTFPYLKDEKQELGKAWGATRTPEFFVLDSDRHIVYMGAMDNDTDAEKATINYVDKAVQAALEGKKPEVEETVAIGCNIRYKRIRRRN
ncbi:redoxin family protein [bacterium]|nr:redoxin family protein [bacterium]